MLRPADFQTVIMERAKVVAPRVGQTDALPPHALQNGLAISARACEADTPVSRRLWGAVHQARVVPESAYPVQHTRAASASVPARFSDYQSRAA